MFCASSPGSCRCCSFCEGPLLLRWKANPSLWSFRIVGHHLLYTLARWESKYESCVESAVIWCVTIRTETVIKEDRQVKLSADLGQRLMLDNN